jgi:hypothetical protein
MVMGVKELLRLYRLAKEERQNQGVDMLKPIQQEIVVFTKMSSDCLRKWNAEAFEEFSECNQTVSTQ